MQVTTYRSSKEVIDKVYADNAYDISFNFEDMLEWIYECMELIGYPFQYIPKIAGSIGYPELEITDYKAKLPCDFHKLRGILVNGYPARHTGSDYHHLLSGDCCDFTSSNTSLITTTVLDNFGNEFASSLGIANAVNDTYTFDINDNYLTLGAKTGKVCISYWAFPLDDNGYPLIPDIAKYRLALSKYLSKKIDWILLRRGEITKDIYVMSELDCNWYMGSISTALKIPDAIQMETFKNMAIRLRPLTDNNSLISGATGIQERKPRL